MSKTSAATRPHGIDAVIAEILYIDVIIKWGGGKVKVGSGGLCICQGLIPSTQSPQTHPCQHFTLEKGNIHPKARKGLWVGEI